MTTMKKCVAAGVAVVLLLSVAVAVGVTAVFFQFFGAANSSSGANAACTDNSAPALTVDVSQLPTDPNYTPAQLGAAAQIMKVGADLGLPERAQLIALMTAMQESTLGAGAGVMQPNRDGDAGYFQQRVLRGWYGTLEQVQDPAYGAKVFYQGTDVTESVGGAAGPKGYHIPGLVDIKGWEHMALTEAASEVQKPAKKYRIYYAKHEAEARRIMALLAGVQVSDATGSLTDSSLGCSAGTANVAVGDLPTQAQLSQDSANVPCPEGTTDLGGASGGFEGKRVPIRLCSVAGTICTGSDCRKGTLGGKARGEVIVNSLVAPHFMKWLNAVRADGFSPSFSSSFRSWETQSSFSGGNVARPGWSNHQMGAAVDISGLPGSYNRHNCAGFADDGSCKAGGAAWASYHQRGVETGGLFHNEEFWHLEWIITDASTRNVPFIQKA